MPLYQCIALSEFLPIVTSVFHPPKARTHLRLIAVVMVLLSSGIRAEWLLERTVVADMDWQPITVIPLDEQDLTCRQCRGRYVDPLAGVDMSQSPTDADLEVSADTTEVTEGALLFQGNVSLRQGYLQVSADRVTADRARETATATGNVVLRQPGTLIRGSRVEYDSTTEEDIVSDAHYVLH